MRRPTRQPPCSRFVITNPPQALKRAPLCQRSERPPTNYLLGDLIIWFVRLLRSRRRITHVNENRLAPNIFCVDQTSRRNRPRARQLASPTRLLAASPSLARVEPAREQAP